MNNTTRVLMLSLMSVAVLAGCKKDVKPTPPALGCCPMLRTRSV